MKHIVLLGAYVEISYSETLFSGQGEEAQLQRIRVLMFTSEPGNPAQLSHHF